ncbi:MAG: hypothetical protein ACTHKK_08130 [Candidatus Nitrosocosmicus sp.]
MILTSNYPIHRVFRNNIFTILFSIFGVAGIAVGLLPRDAGNLHAIADLIWFISGPLSAIIAFN